jgi:hypothetical protein
MELVALRSIARAEAPLSIDGLQAIKPCVDRSEARNEPRCDRNTGPGPDHGRRRRASGRMRRGSHDGGTRSSSVGALAWAPRLSAPAVAKFVRDAGVLE